MSKDPAAEWQAGYEAVVEAAATRERERIVAIIKARIDIINGFINGLANNQIKVPDELFSALVELRSLLRELQQ